MRVCKNLRSSTVCQLGHRWTRIQHMATLLAATSAFGQDTALTIYNQNFAVIRTRVPLNLSLGVNAVQFAGATMLVEPDSVILRDPAGKVALQVLEQNYRADPVSQGLMLSLFEGRTIEFETETKIVTGKVIRSGYSPVVRRQPNQPYAPVPVTEPIIEFEGKTIFRLPGNPIFPGLEVGTILKPMIEWQLFSPIQTKLDAELSYVTGGLSWMADYNIVAPEKGNTLDLTGWITLENRTGKEFVQSRVQLMGGDVNKVVPGYERLQQFAMLQSSAGGAPMSPQPVTERPFDDYHLYTLPRPITIHDRETKQVEFMRANQVSASRVYIYDGAQIDPNRFRQGETYYRVDPNFGVMSNSKVSIFQEFMNTEANHLGMALPKGRVRFYRRDEVGNLQFTGENTVDHTARNEKVRLFTGNAFDLVGERKRLNFSLDGSRAATESFEIRVRNRKTEPVEVRILEHLYRGVNWDIPVKSREFVKIDSQSMEFVVPLQPNEESVVTYQVHYTWQ